MKTPTSEKATSSKDNETWQFVSSSRKQRRTISVEAVPESTGASAPTFSEPDDSLKRKDSNVENNVEAANKHRSLILSPDSIRRSARDRQGKRDVAYAKAQVRYDMQLVPPVRKNKEFLQAFPKWWMQQHNNKSNDEEKMNASTRRSSRLSAPASESSCCPERLQDLMPFDGESSTLWIPTKRTDWEDSVSEMTAVCTSAGLHRYYAQPDHQKPFVAPLSRDYIRDRVDIDDPLRGFQIRHKEGGWLQGFLLWTNFTTWTHFFKWDSLDKQSGVQSTSTSLRADRDGSLANELEACSRSGDPLVGGIVFPEIAEIALVGGLGCGEYLLRMALDGIRAEGRYKYVVLQATDASKGFYERFGFVRVGAVCRYSSNVPSSENPLVGYRHWTHPNESDASLQLHGGPSYMMCLKLPLECISCGRANCDVASENSFLEVMIRSSATELKPTVEQLGGSIVPASWKSTASSVSSGQTNTVQPVKRGRGRPRLYPRPDEPVDKKATAQSNGRGPHIPPPPIVKRRFSNRPGSEPASKRRKTNTDDIPRNVLLNSPPRNAQRPNQQMEAGVPPPGVAPIHSASKRGRKPKKSSSKKPANSGDAKERIYHSVRGPDGKFIRILADGSEDSKLTMKAANPKVAPSKPVPEPVAKKSTSKRAGPKRVNRVELKKQKVKAYPRDRVHFYNKVVKPKNGNQEYYFVLNYDEGKQTIQIVPMQATGLCLGRHAGRPRYQCIIGDTDENFRTESVGQFQIVPSTMVMKTSVVAQEAWDIQDNT
eukprot:scaffold638_cov168-Amphora_coffeaeformis.AAC.18